MSDVTTQTALPTAAGRHADPRVERLIVERWSPRAFDTSTIPDADLAVIFEAAGWAPSSSNNQPWKFLYAKREDADWARFLGLLIPFNQSWVKDASVLIFIVSDGMTGEGDKANASYTHSFDAGAASALLALQASALGYHAHGMAGVDFDAARAELKVPERWRIEAAYAIGRQTTPDHLPEALRGREVPSGRKPVAEIAVHGDFG